MPYLRSHDGQVGASASSGCRLWHQPSLRICGKTAHRRRYLVSAGLNLRFVRAHIGTSIVHRTICNACAYVGVRTSRYTDRRSYQCSHAELCMCSLVNSLYCAMALFVVSGRCWAAARSGRRSYVPSGILKCVLRTRAAQSSLAHAMAYFEYRNQPAKALWLTHFFSTTLLFRLPA